MLASPGPCRRQLVPALQAKYQVIWYIIDIVDEFRGWGHENTTNTTTTNDTVPNVQKNMKFTIKPTRNKTITEKENDN